MRKRCVCCWTVSAALEHGGFWLTSRASQNTQHCWQVLEQTGSMWVSRCGVRARGGGGQKATQQLTPRCVCHSACLHGDTLACPSSACHLLRCNTTTRCPQKPHPRMCSFRYLRITRSERKNGDPRMTQSTNQRKKKLTFPSSSSVFRSNDRCSWTVLPEEPLGWSDEERQEKENNNLLSTGKKKRYF